MILYVLKDSNGLYYSRSNDKLSRVSVLTTRHFQEAKFFIHNRVRVPGFALVKLVITEHSIQ